MYEIPLIYQGKHTNAKRSTLQSHNKVNGFDYFLKPLYQMAATSLNNLTKCNWDGATASGVLPPLNPPTIGFNEPSFSTDMDFLQTMTRAFLLNTMWEKLNKTLKISECTAEPTGTVLTDQNLKKVSVFFTGVWIHPGVKTGLHVTLDSLKTESIRPTCMQYKRVTIIL